MQNVNGFQFGRFESREMRDFCAAISGIFEKKNFPFHFQPLHQNVRLLKLAFKDFFAKKIDKQDMGNSDLIISIFNF